MKNIILIAPIGFLTLGCSNDDDSNELSQITGNWKLIEASIPGVQIVNEDYSNEIIIYNFKANGTLMVSGGENENYGYPNGEYQYSFEEDYLGGLPEGNPISLVKINDSKWMYGLTNEKMTLGRSYIDGPDLIFERE